MTVGRKLLRSTRDTVQIARRQIRRFVQSPSLAIDHWRYRKKLRNRDWAGMRAMLPSLAKSALTARDHRFVSELGYAALRLGERQAGMEWIQAARLLSGKGRPTDWRGEDIRDATLLINLMQEEGDAVALGIRSCGQMRDAAAHAGKTVLVVEPRMVPLFQRTLPDVRVLAFDATTTPHIDGKVVTATLADLWAVLGDDAERPLLAAVNADETRELRDKYFTGLPLIGISWWSSHVGKDLPPVLEWARLVRQVPAQFVSIQYGDVSSDLTVLRGNSPDRLIVDPSVDQLANMDRFASQIAALDLVITISNSGAHLTAAIGKPMILVRDDLVRRGWPYLSRTVPGAPHITVIGKDGRDWNAVFDEIIATAQAITGPANGM
jgi:hypothetical protein